ncbi:MAG: M48 family metalloprotease [Myxococcales bacterium]|nr:M48 family metalloprotease [Myxococcales bacterium]
MAHPLTSTTPSVPLGLDPRLQTAALLALLLALLAGVGALSFGGWLGAGLSVGAAAWFMFQRRPLPPAAQLRQWGARRLHPLEAPGLSQVVSALARRAGVPAPQLHLIPSDTPQAMALGEARQATVAVTTGLLHRLSERELVGVLAHELAHLRHGDIALLTWSQIAGAVTTQVARLGLMAGLLLAPFLLLAGQPVPWLGLLLLWLTPAAVGLVQLALSRTREFEADAAAATLTGDPLGLASALDTLERGPRLPWPWSLLVPRRSPRADAIPDWLRSHPATPARVARLRALAGLPPAPPARAQPSPYFRSSRRSW